MATAVSVPNLTSVPAGRRWVGACLGSVVVIAAATGTWLAAGPGQRGLGPLMDDNVLTNAVNGVVIGTIAAVLMFLRPSNRVGWLLMYAGGVNAVAILGEGWALASYHLDLPGRTVMAWLASWVWATALILGATVLPAIYPTGRAVGRFGRRVVRIGWVVSLVAGLALGGLDDTYTAVVPGHDVGHNPVSGGHLPVLFAVLAGGAAVCGVVLVVVTLVWTLRRLRRATSPEREQLAWLSVAVLPAIVAGFVAPPPVLFAVTLLTSAALVIGIVRHQLFDIKLVLRSSLLYGLLLAIALGSYFGVVEVVTLVAPGGIAAHAFAAAAVALLVVPAHQRLTGTVARLVYGDRDDPVRALGRVSAGLGSGPVGTELSAMVVAVATAARSPHVAVLSPAGDVLAEAGREPGHPTYDLPLRHGDDELGSIRVAWRTAADRPTAADRRVVEALAGPVALALRATRLAGDLAESRSRVIAIRERERSRLRSDLHDGLGPSLSGVALGIEAALTVGDGQRLQEILTVVHGEVAGLLTEVRHLIDDLGPAGLEVGGLVTALRSHAQAVSTLGGVQVSVSAETVPDLPRPVEVVLHRVATEALTNVVRHAEAPQAWVRIGIAADAVLLTVEDDGSGCGDAPDGVGRTSMRDRVASVGGTFAVLPRAGGGTVVRASVPVAAVPGGRDV